MSTAIGTYATLAAAKSRLGISDSTDDTLLSGLCDQVNGWIESITGRVLAPVPLVSTTLAGAVAAGATSFTVAAATNIRVGDSLLLGPVAGTHEHAIIAAIAGATVTPQSPIVNAYSAGDAVVTVILFDGYAALESGRLLPVPAGLIYVSRVEVATYTGGAFTSVPMADIFLGPRRRTPGWPATELWMTDIPSAGNNLGAFYPGFQNVRVIGQPGWPAIVDEIADLATGAVVTRYKTRATGGADSALVGVDGERTFIRNLSWDEKQTLLRHAIREVMPV